MKLKEAHICINCEEILTWPISTCPKCGSGQIIALGRWIKPVVPAEAVETALDHLRAARG